MAETDRDCRISFFPDQRIDMAGPVSGRRGTDLLILLITIFPDNTVGFLNTQFPCNAQLNTSFFILIQKQL